jgi:hypothetical protein
MPIKKYVQEIHESSRKPIKTTSLKPGDGIMYLFIYLPILERQGSYRCLKSLKVVGNESSKIKDLIVLEFQQRCLKTLENYFFIWTVLFPRNKCMLTVIFDLQDVESIMNRHGNQLKRQAWSQVMGLHWLMRIFDLSGKIPENTVL